MSAKLRPARLQFTPYNDKIADITETDTAKHFLDVSTIVPVNTIAVVLANMRASGTGSLQIYPNEGTNPVYHSFSSAISSLGTVAIKNQRIQYAQTVSGDDFDLFMFGYFTQGQ